jgi:hypothetical protein
MTMEDQSTTPETPTWFIDEGIPGAGPRPGWLPEKYKTVADMAKSNSELERKLGTAPDEYDFSKSKYLDPDYAPFEELKKVAKDKRVPQEVMDKMLESVDKYMDEFSIDREEEIKKLGDNASERITTLDNWLKANSSKESYEAIASSLRNADAVKALEELRGKFMSNTPQVPTGNTGAVDGKSSLEDIKMELSNNLQKYKTDINYQKDLQRRLEIAAKNTPAGYIDKVGA